MEPDSFYIDTCIYLNLWQKERGWRLTKRFFEKLGEINTIIYYSGSILRELKFILFNEEFNKRKILFEIHPNFKEVKLSQDEFYLARKIEYKTNFKISFYDIFHLILTKKTNSILITRDKKLLKIAKRYSVIAKKPEDIL